MKLKTRTKLRIRFISIITMIASAIISSVPTFVYADGLVLNSTDSLNYYLNGIYYYNPNGSADLCGTSNIGNNSPGAGNIIGGAGYEKLKNTVREYGEFAMELQKQYGTPWELVFAQMQKESQTGECTGCVASGVASLGYYNWLGITDPKGTVGDVEPYTSSSGRKWAMFTSIDSMMNVWAGWAVAHNGRYDTAFQYTDPNNYNLEAFINAFINVYAPPSENDTQKYVSDVLQLINGPIATVRIENGWPSSAELAQQENIPVGGSVGMNGGSGSNGSGVINNLLSVCGPQSGNLTSFVLAYAWPEYHAPDYVNMKPDYQEAVNRRVQSGKYVGGMKYAGIDCGGFVTTLLQESGFDPNYGGGGSVPVQHNYVIQNDWEVVSDISDLKPGDVAFNHGDSHTFVYVGNIDGFSSPIASASLDERAPMAGKENMNNVTWYHKR